MIEYIVEYNSDKPIIFCEAAGYHQPLVGVYSKVILCEVENFISTTEVSDKSFHHFLKSVEAEIIHPEKLSFYKDELFFNVNRPEDFEELKKIFIHNN